MSADDAKQLAAQFDHFFKPEELTGLRQFEIALKLPKRKGNPPYPFKAYTLPIAGAESPSENELSWIKGLLIPPPAKEVEASIASPLAMADFTSTQLLARGLVSA